MKPWQLHVCLQDCFWDCIGSEKCGLVNHYIRKKLIVAGSCSAGLLWGVWRSATWERQKTTQPVKDSAYAHHTMARFRLPRTKVDHIGKIWLTNGSNMDCEKIQWKQCAIFFIFLLFKSLTNHSTMEMLTDSW